MTETDNPDVKAHIEPKKNTDQFLKRITELDDNDKNVRNYFESREIKPVVIIGTYDKTAGIYDLANGGLDTDAHTISTDATSAAATTWTVTTGKKWLVYMCGGSNNNRATGYSLTIGGTVRTKTATTSAGQSNQYNILGGQGVSAAICNGPIVISAGVAIVLTDLSFQAADVVSKTIIYKEIDA